MNSDSDKSKDVAKGINKSLLQKLIGAVVVLVLIYAVAQPKLNEWFNLGLPGIPGIQKEEQQEQNGPVANKQDSKEQNSKNVDGDDPKNSNHSGKPDFNQFDPIKNNGNQSTSVDKTAKLGEMREIRNNVFQSTAGLVYGPGSVDKHRLKHVMAHAKDNKSKPVHGVFDPGGEREVFALLDEAYLLIKKNSSQVKAKNNDGRPGTSYDINMKRRIGYVGGESGGRSRNPAANYVRMVLENDRVITAFPIRK